MPMEKSSSCQGHQSASFLSWPADTQTHTSVTSSWPLCNTQTLKTLHMWQKGIGESNIHIHPCYRIPQWKKYMQFHCRTNLTCRLQSGLRIIRFYASWIWVEFPTMFELYTWAYASRVRLTNNYEALWIQNKYINRFLPKLNSFMLSIADAQNTCFQWFRQQYEVCHKGYSTVLIQHACEEH